MIIIYHFLVLNLLILGITTDQNFLPTLLLVEPVSAMVSTLPVKTFSLPILNYTQLSFFVSFYCCLRARLEEVRRGESQVPMVGLLIRSYTTSASSSSVEMMPSAKQGCASASVAVILSLGDFLSILVSRFMALESMALYSSPSKVMLLALFCANTSLQVFPGKALTPSSRIWKMSPKLNISHMGQYLVFMSLMLMTSGATQPGVPHLTKRYSATSENSARPKSAITHQKLPWFLKRMFYGLRSRCMIFLECISFNPLRMEWMAVLISCGLNLYLAFTLSQSCPPSSSSTTIYSEFQDQNTSKSLMQFLWLRFLMISISLMRHSFPLSSEYAAYFEKAFTAQLLPSSNFSARQTEAKFPLPIFFLGLNCSWKPRWLSFALRRSRHCCRSEDDRRLQVLFCQFFSKVTEGGEGRQENLTSKSKARKVLDLREDSIRQRQQMATVTSPSSWRWAWQVVRSLPVGLGAVWEQRESEISIGLQYVIKKSRCNSSIA